MKNNIVKKIVLSFVVVLSAIVITSCMSDNLVDCGCDEQSADKLTLNIDFKGSGTRAIESGDISLNERKIESLDVFFYEGTELKWKVVGVAFDAAINRAIIPILNDKRYLFDGNTTHTYDVHVIANNTADVSSIAEGDNNLQTLKDIVFATADFTAKGGLEKQNSFVMDGVISKIINLNEPNLGEVQLKRAASKIRLRLVEIAVPGFELDGDPSVQLVHFPEKSSLLDGGADPVINSTDWKTTITRELSTDAPAEIGGGKTTAAPFYTYTNDWRTDDTRETYLDLYIPLKNLSDNDTKTYRYRVPVTPQNLTGDEEQYMNRLDRNFLYDIAVIVKILGSVEEPPVEITGNYIIKDWTTQEVLVDVKGAHYLVVSEQNVTMPNINNYTLTFNSSIPNVTLVPNSLKATYTYVDNATGQSITNNVTQAQMPTVTVQPSVASGTISITSPIPINYIPKDIEFKITNGQLTESIIIKQMPATYFTVERGVRGLGENGNPITIPPNNLKNQYMYTITTLAPAGDIIWGFPPIGSGGYTVNSAEVANMVSPRFMMASQLGAVLPMSFNNARNRCNSYWEETIKNGETVRYDDWRLPTEAEIKYINDLQRDTANNPQGIVLHARYYWDAYSANGAYYIPQGTNTGATSTNAHIRCVRDIKD